MLLTRFARQPATTTLLLRTMSSAATTAPLVLSSVSASGKVALLKLNRPQALNALSTPLVSALNAELIRLEQDDSVGCVVLTGEGRAFAAGADIKEMQNKTFAEAFSTSFLSTWTRMSAFPKPIIAAVNGFALGGGCELAMMADIVLASENAKFGQPEVNLGILPGAGGTQRLLRAVGKSRAMELCLTGKHISASEASSFGLVSRVVSDTEGQEKGQGVVEEAVKVAEEIASKGALAVRAVKDAVNAGEELSLEQGLKYERQLFWSMFGTEDQKEGMAAFVEKRKPDFKGR